MNTGIVQFVKEIANMFERELEAARARLQTQEIELERTTAAYKQALTKNMPATAKVTGAKMKRYEFAVALSRENVKELEQAVAQASLDLNTKKGK